LRTAVIILWLAVFAGSFIAWTLTPPEGDGFTRGLNRAGVLLTLQGAAIVLAALAWMLSRRQPPSALRRMLRAPLVIEGMLLLAAAAAAAFAVLAPRDEPPPPPSKPVTSPQPEPT
jgi:hypothetical protein